MIPGTLGPSAGEAVGEAGAGPGATITHSTAIGAGAALTALMAATAAGLPLRPVHLAHTLLSAQARLLAIPVLLAPVQAFLIVPATLVVAVLPHLSLPAPI